MEITWYGLACFRITERGTATIVTDPFDESIGLKVPRLKSDILTSSHSAPGHANLSVAKGARVLTGPGEYEIGGVFITGVATPSKTRNNTIFVFEVEGLTVAHLGDLDHVPSQSRIEALGTVDILLVPVGGGSALHASNAAEVINLIEPSIVIPMHYKTDELNLKLEPLSKFLKEMGIANPTVVDSFKVTKSNLPEETQTIILSQKEAV
jgi:L-ascorbate metabolism protein UlaG (beta-lactamase superfamily)